MADRLRPRRNPARYLAPLALAATIAGVYLVTENALDTTPKPRSTHPASTARRSPGTGKAHASHPKAAGSGSTTSPASNAGPAYYTVRAGDNLSIIAARTGVSVSTLLALNHGVSPSSLQIGQRLRLRR